MSVAPPVGWFAALLWNRYTPQSHEQQLLTTVDARMGRARGLAGWGQGQFTDALPRNGTGKIHKPTQREGFGEPAAA